MRPPGRRVAGLVLALLLAFGGAVPARTAEPGDGPCDAIGPAEVPEAAHGVSSTVADLDGDGRDDRFVLYRVGEWRMRADLGAGPHVDVAVRYWTAEPRVAGAADLDGDGRDEIFVDPREGLTAQSVGLVVLHGCELAEVEEAGGDADARFVYNRDRPHLTVGVDCVDVDGDGRIEIVETEAHSRSGEWSYLAHRLDGAEAVKTGAAQGTDRRRRPMELRFGEGVACGGFEYP